MEIIISKIMETTVKSGAKEGRIIKKRKQTSKPKRRPDSNRRWKRKSENYQNENNSKLQKIE